MYTGTLINDLMAIAERTQLALCQGEPSTGAMTPEAVQAWWDIELKAKPALAKLEEPLGQCWHETLESSAGACDGGERCPFAATHEVNGMAFCDLHGWDEQAAQAHEKQTIVREIANLNRELQG